MLGRSKLLSEKVALDEVKSFSRYDSSRQSAFITKSFLTAYLTAGAEDFWVCSDAAGCFNMLV